MPAAKTGYSKSGKSLKALRRYYALQNQAKKSPEEEKLSKRIAAELQTQQTANEKRGAFDNEPTQRSALPVVVSPKETTGPVFTVPSPAKSAKSHKSMKSHKSEAPNPVADVTFIPEPQPLTAFEKSCILLFPVPAVCLIVAMVLELSLRKNITPTDAVIKQLLERHKSLSLSCGMASAAITSGLSYLLLNRNGTLHNTIAAILIIVGEAVFAYALATFLMARNDKDNLNAYAGEINDQALFCLAVATALLGLVLLGLIIKQMIAQMRVKMRERSTNIDGGANISTALGAL